MNLRGCSSSRGLLQIFKEIIFLLTISEKLNFLAGQDDLMPLSLNDRQQIQSPLTDKHIVVNALASVLHFNMIRNSTGHIVKVTGTGMEILNWLSRRYRFTHSVLQINDTGFEPSNGKLGLADYLINNKIDIAITVVPTEKRAALADFTHTVNYSPASYLIPMPDSTPNALAVVQPFSLWVWVEIIGSIFIIMLLLFLLTGFDYLRKNFAASNRSSTLIDTSYKQKFQKYFRNGTTAIVALFLRQAGHWNVGVKPTIRLIVGAWGLNAFFLHNYYTGDLTSYLAATNPQPLIKSIENVRNRTDIHLVTLKEKNADALMSSAQFGLLKDLGDMLRAYPSSRCLSLQQCIEMVKGGAHVYIDARDAFLMGAMVDDYRSTGKCNLKLGSEVFVVRSAWALKKKSPYTKTINIGLMKIRESGLLYLWTRQFTPRAHQCLNSKNTHQVEYSPLPIRTMLGIFTAFLIGFVASFLTFFGEIGFYFIARFVLK